VEWEDLVRAFRRAPDRARYVSSIPAHCSRYMERLSRLGAWKFADDWVPCRPAREPVERCCVLRRTDQSKTENELVCLFRGHVTEVNTAWST
jgi:hypothetical protein